MELPEKIQFLDINSPTFAEDFKNLINLEQGESIQVMTPQFDRVDGRTIEAPTLSLEAWKNLPQLDHETLSSLGLGVWKKTDSQTHYLFPKEWYNAIPAGLLVDVIDGNTELFEPGVTDDDTRFGLLAYGFIKRNDGVQIAEPSV